jgi:DNA modification methylase
MCGDSTKAEDVERLMGGEKADMVFTDPPYNVQIVGGTHDPRDTKNYGAGPKIINDAMSDDDFDIFLLRFFSNMHEALKNGGAYYVCAPAGRTETQFRNALDTTLTLRQCIVWVKQQQVFGRQDYHWRHESVLYGWRDGAAHYFTEDKTQNTVWEIDRPMRSDKEHPTQKPPELVARAINNSSKSGEIVFDLFLGSGTTAVAAERTGRICYGMEIEPKYCAVALERLAGLGLEPRRVGRKTGYPIREGIPHA